MGIKGLMKVISDNAPNAIENISMDTLNGRMIAIDANICMYQFEAASKSQNSFSLSNMVGESTNHLSGLFYRTIKLLEHGIKPIYVFDGGAIELKSSELKKRKEKKETAKVELEKAKENGDTEAVQLYDKRTTSITPKMYEEAKTLLRFMGIPVIEASHEAEAQCSMLCKNNLVWATGTEDMDALACGTPILIRHLSLSENKKVPVQKINLEKVLQELNISMDSFIDLCILLGCDYSDKIKGIGPVKALALIKQHKNIEKILEHLDTKKHPVPNPFPYEEIRTYFKHPNSLDGDQCNMVFSKPKEEALITFMVHEKGFDLQRIQSGIARINKTKMISSQSRITSFFPSKK